MTLLFALAWYLLPSAAFILPLRWAAWTVVVWGLWAVAWRVVSRLDPARDLPFRVLTALFIFEVLAASIVAWLGFFRILTLGWELIVLSGLLLAVAADRRTSPAQAIPAIPSDTRRGRLVNHGIAIFSGLILLLLAVNYVRYPTCDADNMYYHYPMVAEWIRNGSIWPADHSPITIMTIGYPGFREAVMAALSLPLHNEHLGLVGCIEPTMVFLGVFILVRRFSQSTSLALAGGAYAITVPMIWAGTKGNDIALGLLTLLSGLYLADWFARPSKTGAILAGLAIGGLAAGKYSGLFFGGFFLFAMILFLVAGRARRRTAAIKYPSLAQAGCVILAAIAVATPWYLRNVLQYANPLWPASIQVAGVVLFRGGLPQDLFGEGSLHGDIGPLIHYRRYFVEAFGYLIPLIALAPLWAVIAWVRRANYRLAIMAFAGLMSVLVVMFLYQPFNKPGPFGFDHPMRFLLAPFFLGVVVTASAGGQWRYVTGALTALLVAGAIANAGAWTHFWWLFVGLAGVAAAASVLFDLARPMMGALLRTGRLACWPVWGVVLVGAIGVDYYARHLDYVDFPSHRGWGAMCSYVHRNIHDQRIVVCGDDQFFPLYGDEFSNAIVLLRGDPSADEVMAACRREHAGYVVAFVPMVSRAGATDYGFGESPGAKLIERFGGQVHNEEVPGSQGAYLLRITPP